MIVKGQENWDGTRNLDFVEDDGGRHAAGFRGKAGDCVCRAVTIASGRHYIEVYAKLARETGKQRAGKKGKRPASARNGINVRRKWFKDYMTALGFKWYPTMAIGSGCKVHLLHGELPMGRLAVRVGHHVTAVIDGVIHDTYNPTDATIMTYKGAQTMSHRCVYGYWRLENTP